MVDTPLPNKTTLTTKAVVGGLSPLAILLTLPQPYAAWAGIACAVFAGAGFAATQIPLPDNQSGKLWLLYRALNFLALNWKYAANAAAALQTSAAVSNSTAATNPADNSSTEITK